MTYPRAELSGHIDRVLGPLLASGLRAICLIDPPGHPNVGDSAILLGELDFLARHQPRARLSFYDVDSYRPAADRFIGDADVLLLHGGGNFGDLWTRHHDIRLAILRRFPRIRTIQLPQSIHFTDSANLAETARVIARHDDFTLLVRDEKSYAFAKKHFSCVVELMPDMAFAMDPIRRLAPATDFFCLLRGDKEAVAQHDEILATIRASGRSLRTGDWLDESPSLTTRLDRRLRRLVARAPAVCAPFQAQLMSLRRKYAEERVTTGIKLLSQGAMVVTDRLHAHIMSSLLDIPSLTFDSLDGKISAFASTWGADGTSRICRSVADLADRLPALDLVG